MPYTFEKKRLDSKETPAQREVRGESTAGGSLQENAVAPGETSGEVSVNDIKFFDVMLPTLESLPCEGCRRRNTATLAIKTKLLLKVKINLKKAGFSGKRAPQVFFISDCRSGAITRA
jgi:hypothetical protein